MRGSQESEGHRGNEREGHMTAKKGVKNRGQHDTGETFSTAGRLGFRVSLCSACSALVTRWREAA